ncbi:SDR family NAD(P)-dependent oxidoreductase [Salipiger pacificus]|uniref:SDR family NAD(P)-dependent oxidoreductase n=1 Tax=Alloyangia sp. H15 TaxID=3029062 RepID=A0AAU8ALL0_9RHOB|nr:SDR family NAD(P)-dependent oxidoreductase [Alloyangia pacifica]
MRATTAFGVTGGFAMAAGHPTFAESSGPAPRGQRYGAGVYNTDQVAEELRYIEDTVQRSSDTQAKRILITGSTAGVGQLAAAYLLRRGHQVVAHARNAQRASEVARDLPGIEAVVVGDLINLDETRDLADQINRLGTFDVIVHNAGEYGLSDAETINANSVSPYLLTALVDAPREAMVYLSSSLHTGGDLKLDTLRSGGTNVNYNDSKLHMATLATAVARQRPGLRVNAVRPGWVATLMGFHNGPHAPDDLRAGYMTQVWLSEGTDPASDVTGRFLFHQQEERRVNPSVYDEAAQDALLAAYAARTGVTLT